MYKTSIKSWVVAVMVAACGSVPVSVQATIAPEMPLDRDYQGVVNSGGIDRTYYVHLPPSYRRSRPSPVVLALHGGGARGTRMAAATKLNQTADKYGFVVVYPDAKDGYWIDPGKEDVAPSEEVTFISRLLQDLKWGLNVDQYRVYATGISNGGFFAESLAMSIPGKFAAIAPVCATLGKTMVAKTPSTLPIPVMYICGTEDPIVPYNGGTTPKGSFLSAGDTVKYWTKNNDAGANGPLVTMLPNLAPRDGCRAKREYYPGRRTGDDVVLYSVLGGGHTWPGAPRIFGAGMGKTCQDFEANEAIWQFFYYHPNRQLPR